MSDPKNNLIPVNLASITAITQVVHDGYSLTSTDPTFANLILDGVAIAVGNWVLIKDQADTTQNGLYYVNQIGNAIDTNWQMQRRHPADDLCQGQFFIILGGETLVGEPWRITSANPITAGASALAFAKGPWLATLLEATDSVYILGGFLVTSDVTTSSGPGAVAITGAIHEITTTATGNALTLANGVNGQHLTIIYVAEAAGADTAILTPTTLAGGTTITFNAVGDSANLVYSSNGGWYFLGGAAVVA